MNVPGPAVESLMPGRARRWILAGAIAAVAIAGAAVAWHRYDAALLARLPAIDLSHTPAGVRGAIEREITAVRSHPRSGQAWGRLGLVLRAHEFGPQAVLCLEMAGRLDPREFLWPYLYGVSQALSDPRAAETSFERAAALRPREPLARLRLAELSLAEGKIDAAQTEFRAALALEPDSARALLGLARCALSAGDAPECRQLAEQALPLASGQRAPRELLAQACRRLGDDQAAEEQARALAAMPAGETNWDDPYVARVLALRRDPAWLAQSAASLMDEGRTAEAIPLLEEAARDDDSDPHWKVLLSRALIANRESRRAAAVIERGIARHPDSVDLQLQLGALRFQEHDWRQAARAFRAAAKLKPDSSQAHYNLGQALRRQDDTAGAIDAFRRAVQIAPGLAAAHANLGEMLVKTDRREEGLRHLRLAVGLDPADAAARRMLEAAEE